MKKRKKKAIRILAVLFLGGILICAGIFGIGFVKASAIVKESGRTIFSEKENSYIYGDDGQVLAKLNTGEDRVYLTYDQIPETVVQAFVAVEDRRFYSHPGVDALGILRSMAVYVKSGGGTIQGGSTITQQLARTVFLSNEVTIERKVKEIFLAMALEARYSKEDILEFYINNVYFANGNYGIEAAAQSYFGRSSAQLDVSEVALLCAIPNSPTWYDPRAHLDHTLMRRDKILKNMREQGYISAQELDIAQAETPVILEKKSEWKNDPSSYALDCAVRYLMKDSGFSFVWYFASDEEYRDYKAAYEQAYEKEKERIYRGKFKIYTSLNSGIQNLLQEQTDNTLTKFTDVGDDGVYVLQSAGTVIDNATGKVVAVVGGRSQTLSESHTLNRAYQSFRQPGSSIKPLLVYGPALEKGYSASSVLQNISVEELKKNPTKELTGSPMQLDVALYKSENGPACWLLKQIGVSNGLSYLEKMHFSRLMYSDQNIVSALGGFTYGTNVIEMAGAYRSFAAGGSHVDPTCITSVIYDDKELWTEEKETEVYTAKASQEMIRLLEGVVQSGTARRLGQNSQVPRAGKTGTTNDNKDGWFCCMIPDYTVSVWVGCDNPQRVPGLSGGSYPLTIVKGVIEQLDDAPKVTNFAAFQKTIAEEDLTFSKEVGAYDSYLPGRDDAEELSPGYTVANYRQDHMLADQIDVLLNQAMEETDASKKSDLITQAEALKGQIFGRTVSGEVETKIAYVKGQQ